MVPEIQTEVLIVGGGPTGLMAALLLVKCGIRVRILDRSATQAHESRALGMQARTLELMLQLGLDGKFLDAGVTVHGLQLFASGKSAANVDFSTLDRTDTPFPFVLVVPQSETESILLVELNRLGVQVERETTVESLAQDDAGVAVTASRPGGTTEAIPARYVIGADGAHSIVRKELGLSFEGAPYASTFLLADGNVAWPENLQPLADRVALFVHGKFLGAYFPLQGESYGRVLAMDITADNKSSEQQGAIAASLDEVIHSFREATASDVTISNPGWISRYRVHHRGVDRYRVGRCFVAGDAAHIHSPAGAQGMNTGLQDVANLCWKLALVLRGAAADELLNTYNAERWPVGRQVLEYTDAVFSSMTTQNSFLADLRNAVLPAVAGTLTRRQAVREKLFSVASELDIHYSPNAYVQDGAQVDDTESWKHGVGAGHRAPNARISRGGDVFSLIGSYGFHLLALSRLPLSRAAIAEADARLAAAQAATPFAMDTHLVTYLLDAPDGRTIRADSPDVFHAYAMQDTEQALFLIRPDGFVAWRSRGWQWPTLEAFLRKLTAAGN